METEQIKVREPNPRKNACFLSVITYYYALPAIIKGLKRKLEETDLFQILPEAKSSRLGSKLEYAWYNQTLTTKSNKPSLWRAIFRIFFWDTVCVFLLAIASDAVWITQPIFCGKFLQFFLPGQTNISKDMAYVYGCGIIVSAALSAILMHSFGMAAYDMAMKMKVAIGSLIYRKILKLNQRDLGKTHAGQIINMLSNDMDKLTFLLLDPVYLLIGPLECLVCLFLLYEEIAIASVTGILIIIAFVPMQVLLGYVLSIYRKKAARRADERTKLINEVISGMQIIKMFTWEDIFSNSVIKARRTEMNSIGSKLQVMGIIESFFMFASRLAIFGTLLTNIILGYSTTTERIFVLYAFHAVLRQSMTCYFPDSMSTVAQANVSIKRVRDFLLLDDVLPGTKNDILTKEFCNMRNGFYTPKDELTRFIKLRNASASWDLAERKKVINNVSLTLKSARLIAIVGSVGSGKTSLLQIILKQLPLCAGTIEIIGEISYASQDPWLFAGTVRQNILFGLPMNEARYQNVIKVCALRRDINLFPYGDLTLVGEKGFSLSGGQRARINLARAIYKDTDIYLLDDPLAAVDSNVAKHIFENCISSYLRHKIVILSTNQLQFLKDVDYIIYLEDGAVKAEGSYQQLMNMSLNLKELIKKNTTEEINDEVQTLPIKDVINEEESNIKAGTEESQVNVEINVYGQYFKAAGSCCLVFIVVTMFLVIQFVASFSDYMLAVWANMDQMYSYKNQEIFPNNVSIVSDFDNTAYVNIQPVKRQNETKSNFIGLDQKDFIFFIYSSLCILLPFLILVRSSLFYHMIKRISIKLHNDMFISVLQATMRFFTINSSGKILNRFSNDIGIIDGQLPPFMHKSLQLLLTCAGIMFLIASVNTWFLIQIVFLVALVLVLRMLYLKSGRAISRLERKTRSPVYGHVNATLQGLTTIRAFGREKILINEFDNHQDLHCSAVYTFIITTRAFGLWIDMLCVIFMASIVLSYLIFGTETVVGNVGLAVTQAISLARSFQWGIRLSADMENNLTSVERILEYNSIEHETSPSEPQLIPGNWPENGRIEFLHVYLSYFPDDPPVLYNVSFTIYPREKIGIVGRTGAGKSSLISAIFQLTDTEGYILIDNVDVTRITLTQLRSKISIIPQQPVLFSGTLRQNLDPFSKFNDADLWAALEEVELRNNIKNLSGGLDFQVSEGGANFSIGQRQLLCLARAVLCRNRILILDEATANIDHQTDYLIQKTIRKNFSDCTVLTIAHRLNTVINSDRILVMDSGRLMEFDHPYILLQNKFGYFHEMVTGTGNIRELFNNAKESYEILNRTV